MPESDDREQSHPSSSGSDFSSSADRDPLIGERLGPYRLLSRIGAGGMATVYLGVDEALQRRAAVKVLSLMSPPLLARFLAEARSQAQLDHPNIVPVYGAGTESVRGREVYYIALKYIDGYTLADLVREQGPCDPATATRHILAAAQGLEYAHTHGFVHRDVKPGNILIDRTGRALIADFGLVRDQSRSGQPLTQGEFVGTRAYASPEQLRREAIDARSDMYSLGATFLFLLTGLRPGQAEDGESRTLPAIDPALPFLVRTTLGQMLAEEPQERPPAMASCVTALQRTLDHLEGSADSVGSARRASAWKLLAGFLLFVCGASFLFAVMQGGRPAPRNEHASAAEASTKPDTGPPETPQSVEAVLPTVSQLTREVREIRPVVLECAREFVRVSTADDAGDAAARAEARDRLVTLTVSSLGQLDRRAQAASDRNALSELDRLALDLAPSVAGAMNSMVFGPFPTAGGIWIHRFPVTNLQYFAFLLSVHDQRRGLGLSRLRVDPRSTPHTWCPMTDADVSRPRFDHCFEPVLGLSSTAIDALCESWSSRVPTRAEWQGYVAPRLAAPDGFVSRSFVPGADPDAVFANNESVMERVVWDDQVYFAFLAQGRAVFRARQLVRPTQQALRLAVRSTR